MKKKLFFLFIFVVIHKSYSAARLEDLRFLFLYVNTVVRRQRSENAWTGQQIQILVNYVHELEEQLKEKENEIEDLKLRVQSLEELVAIQESHSPRWFDGRGAGNLFLNPLFDPNSEPSSTMLSLLEETASQATG